MRSAWPFASSGAAPLPFPLHAPVTLSPPLLLPFLARRAAKKMLQEHVDSKHGKMTFAQCFPDYVEGA